MITMTNLAIHAIVVPLQISSEISDEISSGNIQKKKSRNISTKRKDKNTVIKEKGGAIKERIGNLDIHKNRYYYHPKAPVARIQSNSVVPLRENAYKKTCEWENLIISLKKEKFP